VATKQAFEASLIQMPQSDSAAQRAFMGTSKGTKIAHY
jgi:hypothetical protein